jgi:hypothetical protein
VRLGAFHPFDHYLNQPSLIVCLVGALSAVVRALVLRNSTVVSAVFQCPGRNARVIHFGGNRHPTEKLGSSISPNQA